MSGFEFVIVVKDVSAYEVVSGEDGMYRLYDLCSQSYVEHYETHSIQDLHDVIKGKYGIKNVRTFIRRV